MTIVDNLVHHTRADLPSLRELRRELHAIPEVGLDLPKTQRVIKRELEALGLTTGVGARCSSVVTVVEGELPGPTVLLRADMDALPIRESSGEEFAAANGNMHACGHDLHMAGLVGAARALVQQRAQLAGRVLLAFQPGEEGHDGAQVMVEEGLLELPHPLVAAYAVHVGAGRPGTVWTRPGTLLASLTELVVEIRGTGGHGSTPHAATDPVAALADMVTALNALPARAMNVLDPVVVSVTQVSAGSAINVIPSTARLAGTARALSSTSVERLEVVLPQLLHRIAAVHGVTVDVHLETRYPVTHNDPGETTRLVAAAHAVLGEDHVDADHEPLMGSEDFSKILQRVPGAMIFVGATPPDLDPVSAPGVHTPQARFDDSVLAAQAAILATAAFDRTRSSSQPP